jgi:hypothetical protein
MCLLYEIIVNKTINYQKDYIVFPVNYWFVFGQGNGQITKSCLNPGHIRTGQGSDNEILSESRSYSDRPRAQKRNPVWIPVLFGQVEGSKVKSCLNPGPIRTGRGLKNEILSESRSYSDRAWAKKWKPVWIPVLFGQVEGSKTKTCLNPGQIRTGRGLKNENLSESRSYSDRARVR